MILKQGWHMLPVIHCLSTDTLLLNDCSQVTCRDKWLYSKEINETKAYSYYLYIFKHHFKKISCLSFSFQYKHFFARDKSRKGVSVGYCLKMVGWTGQSKAAGELIPLCKLCNFSVCGDGFLGWGVGGGGDWVLGYISVKF